MSLDKRILEIREAVGANKSQFGKSLGVSHAAVQQWENGDTKSLSYDVLSKIEKKYGYNPEWVNSGKLPKKIPRSHHVAENQSSYSATARVKKIIIEEWKSDLEFVTGNSVSYEPQAPVLHSEWVSQKGWNESNLSYLEMPDDSMQVTMYCGDIVIIDKSQTNPASGEVFALVKDESIQVKRIQLRQGIWWSISENLKHSKLDSPLDDLVQLVGKVVCKISTTF